MKPEVKVGDRVLFAKYIGSDVTVDGEKLLVARADDIMGIPGRPRVQGQHEAPHTFRCAGLFCFRVLGPEV